MFMAFLSLSSSWLRTSLFICSTSARIFSNSASYLALVNFALSHPVIGVETMATNAKISSVVIAWLMLFIV
nr:MAG TPA: hypothetical protein [Caudoviricetes sp.]